MRISDWSSDVCSSDLDASFNTTACGQGRLSGSPAQPASTARPASASGRRRREERPKGRKIPKRKEEADVREIRRGSRRDRVCQYVVIVVVAVTITNINNNDYRTQDRTMTNTR